MFTGRVAVARQIRLNPDWRTEKDSLGKWEVGEDHTQRGRNLGRYFHKTLYKLLDVAEVVIPGSSSNKPTQDTENLNKR